MSISDFFHFLYQGPTFLKLSPQSGENDSRAMVEIENEPLLFTKESDYTYSVIKDENSLLTIDVTTLNKAIKKWEKFSMHWVRGFGCTAVALCAFLVYHKKSSAALFYPAYAGTLLASGLCLFTIHRIGQLKKKAGPEICQKFISNCNNLRKTVFNDGLLAIDKASKGALSRILTLPETLFLLHRHLQQEFPSVPTSEFHEPMSGLVRLLDANSYPDEKDKKHCEELSQALWDATLNNPILNAYASVSSDNIVDIYDSLRKMDADEIEIPTLQSVIKKNACPRRIG